MKKSQFSKNFLWRWIILNYSDSQRRTCLEKKALWQKFDVKGFGEFQEIGEQTLTQKNGDSWWKMVTQLSLKSYHSFLLNLRGMCIVWTSGCSAICFILFFFNYHSSHCSSFIYLVGVTLSWKHYLCNFSLLHYKAAYTILIHTVHKIL